MDGLCPLQVQSISAGPANVGERGPTMHWRCRPKPWRCVCYLAIVVLTTLAFRAPYLAPTRSGSYPASSLRIDSIDARESTSAAASRRGHRNEAKKNCSNCSAKLGTSSHRIPHILHQTWISHSIPSTYVPYVQSWTAHNPPLTYYYWTDATSLQFVAKHYPHLLATFRGYKAHLSRADAIRYMLLHYYGGIYADMDMMRLKDLTPLLNSSKGELCYLSQERYEITRLFWGRNSSVMNAIMLSSPGHQFMDYVVKALPRYAHHSPKVMESTGPLFLQSVYQEYNRSPPCNLSSPLCRCVAADPYMFMPQVDPIRMPLFRSKCSAPEQLQPHVRAACTMLDRLGWRNDLASIGRGAFTHHGFLHYGFENQRLRFASVADINSVRPGKMAFGKDFH